MLIAVQVLSKVIASKDYSLIENNLLDETYFQGYENEYNFIKDHYSEFHKVPDEVSFLDRFPDFDIVEVEESDRYLLDTIREQHLYMKFTEVLPKAAELLKRDSNEARHYLESVLKDDLSPVYSINDVEIIESSVKRLENSIYTQQNVQSNYIPTGFDEIDADSVGLQRGDEFVVIVARINNCKSWVLEKICTHAVEQGYNVGYFSPEMSVEQVGYRFDTLHGHIPNSAVLFGKFDENFSSEDYENYLKDLKSLRGKLYVTKPKDFNRKLTVTKLKNWIQMRKLDLIAIDGITYLSDERYRKGDNKTTSLTNISEDLMDLSSELKIPVLVVVQANRGGIVDKNSLDTPELENIKDSDGIAANASKVYSVRQMKDNMGNTVLIIDNKKSRTGEVGKSYKYEVKLNTGEFTYKEAVEVAQPDDEDEDKPVRRKKSETSGNAKKRSGSPADAF